MKKQLVLIVLLILPVSYALYDKEIYKGWVLSGEKFIIDNETYRAIYIKSTNSTVIYFPGGLSLAIRPENESCASEWIYRACQTNQKFEKNGQIVPPDIHDPYIDVSLYIILNKTDARLDLAKTHSSDSVYVGDTINIETVIEKYSKEDITNVSFIDVFSDDFVITVIKGCKMKSNTVYWQGDMINKTKHVCEYSIRPVRQTELKNVANLSYDVFGKRISKSQTKTINVDETTLLLNITVPKRNITAGKNTTINVSLEAITDLTINNLKITFPENFKLINNSPELKKTTEGLSLSNYAMEKNDKTSLFFTLNSGFVGSYKINFETELTYNNLVKKIKKSAPINYVTETFFVSLINRNNKSVLQLANPGKNIYKSIEVKIKNDTFRLQRLDARKFHEFEFPLYNQESLNVSIEYWTMYGQIIETKHNLKYGESTYVKEIEGLAEQEDTTQTNTDAKKQRNINLDMRQILTVFGIIFGIVIIIGLIFTIKSKFSKTGLDKEIAEIKEETSESEKSEEDNEIDKTYI